MEKKLIQYLEHIEKLLDGMVELAERQQIALIRIDIKELEQITAYQVNFAKNLRETEQQRIKFLMTALNLNFKDATSLPISLIAKKLNSPVVREYKDKLSKLTLKLQTLNSANRILSTRASTSVKEIFNVFSKNSNHVCNVKI
jgi:flagellar biosynthesis/type III secretory pathway chaperone